MPLSIRDRLIFALDVENLEKARPLLKTLSGKIGTIKVGLELFCGEGPSVIPRIRDLAGAEIFLDLKLHDIPETVARSVRNLKDLGVSLLTLHTAGGREMMARALDVAEDHMRLLGVTVLTSMGPADLKETGCFLSGEDLTGLVLKRALLAEEAGLSGIVCSAFEAASIKNACGKDFLCVTPGIRPLWNAAIEKEDQKRIVTPQKAFENGADMIVVGRPIRESRDPAEAVEKILQEADAVFGAN